MEISRAWAHDSNDVSHLTISHLKVLKKFVVGGVVQSDYSVSSLSKKEKTERDSLTINHSKKGVNQILNDIHR